jgi:hypothetical protein
MLPYEPGPLVIYDQEGNDLVRGMDPQGNDVDFTIWYQSFICPTTGTYKNFTLYSTTKTHDIIGGGGELGVCIYKNKANPSFGAHSLPDATNKMGEGYLEIASLPAKSWDSSFVVISFDGNGVDLSANELYWVAFSYKKVSGEFFMATRKVWRVEGDGHLASQTALKSTNVFWTGSSGGVANFPSTSGSLTTSSGAGGEMYASWFRLSDPDASFLTGPQGPTGPIGPSASGAINSVNRTDHLDRDLYKDSKVRLWWKDQNSQNGEIWIELFTFPGREVHVIAFCPSPNNHIARNQAVPSNQSLMNINGANQQVSLKLWMPGEDDWGYYDVTFVKSSNNWTGTPILCSVNYSSI